jgi:beta-lactamase class A
MAFAVTFDLPTRLDRPAVVEPAPREATFGLVTGRVGPGTERVVVRVRGVERGSAVPENGRFSVAANLPLGVVRLEVVAESDDGGRASARVGPVLALPGVEPARASTLDRDLDAKVMRLRDGFGGLSGVYVQDLGTGRGAAWNARGLFPAASTVKVAIAVEVLRVLAERPPPGSALDRLLTAMLVDSDNDAANELLRWIGGSESAGAAEVTETMAALGLADTELYGAFLTAGDGAPIPLAVEESAPVLGKRTTAWDLARLFGAIHTAAALDDGPLVELHGAFTREDARALLWTLAQSNDHGKLDRYLRRDAVVPHKGGWISDARHDAGLVYTPNGVLVVAVMTWTRGLAGPSSDVLAGKIAAASVRLLEPGGVASAAAGRGREVRTMG